MGQGEVDPAGSDATGPPVEIGIAYGTEKKYWLEGALREFALTPSGKRIKVKLIPMGSQESAHAILGGDKRIHVWSPASAVYKDVFIQEWQLKNGNNPIVREEALALSPMVFVFWEERYEAFVAKYKTVSFETIKQALAEPGGWDVIAKRPEWGLFKFGHTHPNQSNSGLMTLVLLAHTFHDKSKALSLADIVETKFQTWMRELEQSVTGLSNSTGNMMRDMVLKGPSTFDCLFVYENVAIDHLKNAEGRFGRLRVVYPEFNMWNDNPYYVLDVPWSDEEQRRASEIFLEFLQSEPIQRSALAHGFRPGDPQVPIRFAESPFVKAEAQGLRIEIEGICPPPEAAVINNLLLSWQRIQRGR